MRYFIAIIFLIILTWGILAILPIDLNKSSSEEENSVLSENVTLQSTIYACIVDITIYPEKRQPATNNWQTDLDVTIYDITETTELGTFSASTNSLGQTNVNICDQGVNLLADDYIFKIKGLSHLTKDFSLVGIFDFATETITLTLPSQRLLAGDTSVVADNYINSLDLSTQINSFGSSDNRNDLNQDGEVNSLDISNIIFNFYSAGD